MVLQVDGHDINDLPAGTIIDWRESKWGYPATVKCDGVEFKCVESCCVGLGGWVQLRRMRVTPTPLYYLLHGFVEVKFNVPVEEKKEEKKPQEPPFKVGDTVECVDNNGATDLILGKCYIVKEAAGHSPINVFIKVFNDPGLVDGFFRASRFRRIITAMDAAWCNWSFNWSDTTTNIRENLKRVDNYMLQAMNVPQHIIEGPKYIPSAKKAETVWASGFDTPTSVQLATNASQPPVPVSTIKSPGEIEFDKVARYSPGDIKWFELTPVAKDAWERSAYQRATARVQEASANKEIEAMKAAKDSEADFTARVCKALEGAGALVYVMAGGATSSGLPDRLVIHRDWVGFLEFKGPGGRLRENQRQTMVRCRERGFPAFVVRDGGMAGLYVEAIDGTLISRVQADGKYLIAFLKSWLESDAAL